MHAALFGHCTLPPGLFILIRFKKREDFQEELKWKNQDGSLGELEHWKSWQKQEERTYFMELI